MKKHDTIDPFPALSLRQPTCAWINGFGYDVAKRLTNVTSQAGVFAYLYPASRPSTLVSRLALPNTSYLTNTYDTVARLTGTYLKNSSQTTLDSAAYAYNVGHQRTQQTRTDSSTYDFTYDAIGQLKVANSSVNAEDRGYAYDAAWNLNYRTNNGVLGAFTVDSKNQLTNAPSPEGTMTYDNNGNLIISHNEYRTYDYDDENQLVQWTAFQSKLTQFTYDGLGRLRQRLEYMWTADEESAAQPAGEEGLSSPVPGSGSWTLLSETRYLYDGMRVIQERDGSNTPLVSYTRGNDLSGSLEGAGGIGGLLARSHGYSSGNWSTHNFYHADGNGNITYMLNSSQSRVAEYRYDPFGNTISSSGTLAAANVYRFSSKEIHANSELYYYGYRFYSPNLQRWLSRDPIEEEGGINLYAYVSNDPVNWIDPLGLAPGDWWDLPAKYKRIEEIDKEERRKNTGHNDASDAKRHAEASRRIAEECGQAAAAAAGYGHELKNLINRDHGLDEAKMDAHNNAEGRKAAKEGRPVDPKKLDTPMPPPPKPGGGKNY